MLVSHVPIFSQSFCQQAITIYKKDTRCLFPHIPFSNHSDILQLTFYIKQKNCQFLQSLELDIYKTERCSFPTYLFPTILASLSTNPPPPKKKTTTTTPYPVRFSTFAKRKKCLFPTYLFPTMLVSPPPTKTTHKHPHHIRFSKI